MVQKQVEARKPMQPQVQYVPFPTVVSSEEMLNELYKGQTEIKQALALLLERVK